MRRKALQTKSQQGLIVGDLLVIEPATKFEEIVQIAGFGSVILGVPSRFLHRAGAMLQVASSRPAQTHAQAKAAAAPEAAALLISAANAVAKVHREAVPRARTALPSPSSA